MYRVVSWQHSPANPVQLRVLCFISVCFCFSLSLLTLDLNSRGSAIHGISSKFVEINLARESYMDR